jgi:hypothetical protein
MHPLEHPSLQLTQEVYLVLLERALLQYIERFGLSDLARQALCQPNTLSAERSSNTGIPT